MAIAGGIVAFFTSARSLQIGPAVPVIAVTAIAGNASAIPAALIPAPTRATGEPEPETSRPLPLGAILRTE